MSKSYEDYEREYHTYLSRIRSFLASTRSLSTLTECDRLLDLARNAATAMVGLAEVEGDALKIREAKNRLDREIAPLTKEVSRALEDKRGSGGGGNKKKKKKQGGKEELFRGSSYESPNAEVDPFLGRVDGDGGGGADTERLIRDSEDLLRESQALCAESEQIGESTLQTMGRQREQLHIASGHVEETRSRTDEARRIMREMSRRALRNKLFLYTIIVFLIVANGAVLYHMVKKKKH